MHTAHTPDIPHRQTKIRINQETLEESSHSAPEFPYMTDLCDLHLLPGNTFPWHWHNEVELFYIREGELNYVLPGGTHTFRKGEGGFLNANVLHMTTCREHLPCLQEEHIFLPQFIGGQDHSIFMRRYIHPIISQSGLDLLRFDPSIPSHREIIRLQRMAYDCYQQKSEYYEFDIREIMTKIWRLLYETAKAAHITGTQNPHSERIKTMMEYIAVHYPERLTLQDIAGSSYISVRECCRCFQENLGQTPFSYLTDVRLRKACSLLEHTSMSITDICISCGFNSSSYFGKIFRRAFDCTPKDYRRQHTQT